MLNLTTDIQFNIWLRLYLEPWSYAFAPQEQWSEASSNTGIFAFKF